MAPECKGKDGEVVSDRERKAKQDMKKFYDKSAKVKSFSVGEMVLVRKSGLHSKLGESWEGPYQIKRQASPRYRCPSSLTSQSSCIPICLGGGLPLLLKFTG